MLLRLDPSTDSGTKGDNITNVRTPTFDVAAVVKPGTTLQLLRNGVVVPSLSIVTGSAATVNDAGPVPDGTYHLHGQAGQRRRTTPARPAAGST